MGSISCPLARRLQRLQVFPKPCCIFWLVIGSAIAGCAEGRTTHRFLEWLFFLVCRSCDYYLFSISLVCFCGCVGGSFPLLLLSPLCFYVPRATVETGGCTFRCLISSVPLSLDILPRTVRIHGPVCFRSRVIHSCRLLHELSRVVHGSGCGERAAS